MTRRFNPSPLLTHRRPAIDGRPFSCSSSDRTCLRLELIPVQRFARNTGASEASEDMPQRYLRLPRSVLDPGARLTRKDGSKILVLTCLELSPSSRSSHSVRSQAPKIIRAWSSHVRSSHQLRYHITLNLLLTIFSLRQKSVVQLRLIFVAPNRMRIGGGAQVLPIAVVACQNCGHSILFNAIHIGAIKPVEKP